jgi:hypothetical protein
MDHEEPATVCSLMNGARLNRDSPVVTEKPTNKLIMIPRDIYHTRTFPPRSKYFLNHIVVVLRPVNSTFERPNVNKVTHDVEGFTFRCPEELKKSRSLTAPRPEMNVGNPYRPVTSNHN